MAYKIEESQAAELLKIADTIVSKQIKKGLITESERDDYIQELMLIMVQHQDDWIIPENVRFESYANTVMEKRIFSIYRKRHPQKDVLHDALSLNNTFCNEDGNEEEFINRLSENGIISPIYEFNSILNKSELIANIRLFFTTLSDDERELCDILMYHNKAEASRILGKHKHTIWRMINRIREKMMTEIF